MAASQRLTCFCAAAAFRQVPGCVFFTATTACRKMTNGVSGTDGNALTIHALNDLRKSVLIDG